MYCSLSYSLCSPSSGEALQRLAWSISVFVDCSSTNLLLPYETAYCQLPTIGQLLPILYGWKFETNHEWSGSINNNVFRLNKTYEWNTFRFFTLLLPTNFDCGQILFAANKCIQASSRRCNDNDKPVPYEYVSLTQTEGIYLSSSSPIQHKRSFVEYWLCKKMTEQRTSHRSSFISRRFIHNNTCFHVHAEHNYYSINPCWNLLLFDCTSLETLG